MLSAKSALETDECNDSQKVLVVRAVRSLAKCSARRVHFTHPCTVHQRLNHLSLQHSDFQTKGGGRPIIHLRAQPFEACPHDETDPSVDFEREVSVFMDSAA